MTGHSNRTIEYWVYRGFSLEDAKSKVKEVQRSFFLSRIDKQAKGDELLKKDLLSIKQKQASPICIEHWMKKGFSHEESIFQVSKIQSVRSSKSLKFTGKHHSKKSIDQIRANLKQHILNTDPKKWVKHFENYKDSRSKLEIDCFNQIKNLFENTECNISIDHYIADILINKKFIIEIFGDYWHANPAFYKEDEKIKPGIVKDIWKKDNEKINHYKNLGYEVLIIWENDWISNKEFELNRVKSYIC